MTHFKFRRSPFSVLVACVFLFSACGCDDSGSPIVVGVGNSDYIVNLGNGYELIRSSADDIEV